MAEKTTAQTLGASFPPRTIDAIDSEEGLFIVNGFSDSAVTNNRSKYA